MRYCPECHEEFPDYAKFCPDCECGLAYRLDPSHEDDGPPRKVVTLATFDRSEDAALVKAKLESEGIWSALIDTRAACAQDPDNNMFCGIKLQVAESRAEEAIRVLLRARGIASQK